MLNRYLGGRQMQDRPLVLVVAVQNPHFEKTRLEQRKIAPVDSAAPLILKQNFIQHFMNLGLN
jgi:hypothetical protein